MRYLTFLFALSFSIISYAEPLQTGTALPAVEINQKGQIAVEGEDLVYQPWDSTKELGQRLAFVQHLAGRVGVEEMNKNLSDAIVDLQIPEQFLESVIIVNSDDSAFGTGWLISSKLKTNKETYPEATFIEDSKGRAADVWNLAPKTATSLIVKADGEILFSKHGETTDEDIAKVLTVLKAHLPVEAFQAEASLAQH